MKYFKVALLIACTPLLSDCFSWDFGIRTGYRCDNFENTLYDANDSSQLTYKENFKNLNTAQVGGFTTLHLWWLEINADVNYGWTVGGDIETTDYIQSSDSKFQPVFFKSNARGQVWDVFCTGGIRAPFIESWDQNFHFTFLGGYSFHNIQENRNYTQPDSITFDQLEIEGVTYDWPHVSLPETMKFTRDYKGPFAGIECSLLVCRFFSYFGYAYHWINLEQTFSYDRHIDIFQENSFGAISHNFLNFEIENHFQFGPNHGNRAWLSLNYQDLCGWYIGVTGTYFSTSTKKHSSCTQKTEYSKTESTCKINSYSLSNQTKSNWKSLTFTIQGSYTF